MGGTMRDGMGWLAVAAGVAACMAGPASAQVSTPFIDRITAIAQPCFSAKGDPKPIVETCVKALAAINGARGEKLGVTPHEQNMYLANSVFVTTALSRLYTDMDKGQTARVCLSSELSWKSASQFDYAASPDFTERLKKMRDSLVPGVAKCRAEMGTPPDAPPLPAAAAPPAAGKAPATKPKP
jgi:hypothetical protein